MLEDEDIRISFRTGRVCHQRCERHGKRIGGDARNWRSARRSARDCRESARIPASPRLPRSTPCSHPPRFLHDRSITRRSPYRLNLASFHLHTAFRITRNRTIVLLVARQDVAAPNIACDVCVASLCERLLRLTIVDQSIGEMTFSFSFSRACNYRYVKSIEENNKYSFPFHEII